MSSGGFSVVENIVVEDDVQKRIDEFLSMMKQMKDVVPPDIYERLFASMFQEFTINNFYNQIKK